MVNLAGIEAAAARLASEIHQSPLVHSRYLSELTGNRIYLKLENLQVTGSFKERGALNRILTLTDEERRHGIVAASAGNHGQGLAWHATRRGIPVQIWMPRYTPLVKLSATRGYGAEVILHGDTYDDAYAGATARAAETGATFIHAFDDEDVISGQGTLGLELLAQKPELDAVVVPIGGGGLIAGLACAAKSRKPQMEIIGVQTARLPSMVEALSHDEPVSLGPASTLADGIAVRRVGDLTLPLVRQYVDRIVTVEEEDIATAILVLLEREKILTEGAGAIGVAAIRHGMVSHRNRSIAVIISGGNLDVSVLARIIEQGMVRDGRRLRMRVRLPDYPGALEGLTKVIAQAGANIVETLHNRAHYGVSLTETAIDVTMETRGPDHVTEILERLQNAGYEYNVVK